MKARYALYFIGLCLLSCGEQPIIIDRPITWNAQREQLSLAYMDEHYGMHPDSARIIPKMIVIHWTEIPTLEESFAAFDPVELPGTRADISSAGTLNVSAHYLVDRDGTIYQLLPETTFARHVIGLNHCAIGIENVGNGSDLPLTDAQFDANQWLVEYLTEKHESIKYLIGHDQYTRFMDHPLWKEQDPGYLTEKQDVGEEYMEKMHKAIEHSLKPAPGLK